MTVTLWIEGQQSLFILLGSDGLINRAGDGSEEIDTNLFIGKVDPELFQQL